MHATSIIPAPNVMIGEDGLTVTMKAFDPEAGGSAASGPTPAEVHAYLAGLGIAVPDPKTIESLAGANGRISLTEDVIIVRGRRPIAERPGSVQLLQDTADDAGPDVINHYERTSHFTAKAGQSIAKIFPITPGEDGVDVFGNAIEHAKVQPPVELFRNVELDADGMTVRATAPGRVCLARRKLWVATTVEINGDVDFSCGNIDVAGDVRITGSILDMFKVRGANVAVGAAIEAAQVNATGDLTVAGGILGKDKGHIASGGSVTFKYATNANISAGGDVICRGEVAHTRIVCRGQLLVEKEPLASGHVIANGGIVCQTLGSPIEAKLEIEVGTDEFLRLSGPAKLAEITARKTRANHLASTAAQILRFEKTLTPRQKEQLANLLRDAGDAESAVSEVMRPLQTELAMSRGKCLAEILVARVLHAGVVIRFPTAETTIEADWEGPLRLFVSVENEKPQVMLVDTRRNISHPLPCKPRKDEAYSAFVSKLKDFDLVDLARAEE